MRARMVRLLGEAPALRALPKEERESLAESLAMALTGGEYHAFRFHEIVTNLETRREQVRTSFTADLIVTYAIHEAAAAFGAARLAVDEIMHITARLHGAENAAKADKWKISDVVNDEAFARSKQLQVEELHASRRPASPVVRIAQRVPKRPLSPRLAGGSRSILPLELSGATSQRTQLGRAPRARSRVTGQQG